MSRRSLSNSTNLRAGELSEALPPTPASSEVTDLLHEFSPPTARNIVAAAPAAISLSFQIQTQSSPRSMTRSLRKGVGCDPAAITHHVDFCSQRLQKTDRSRSVYPPLGCLGDCATLFRRVWSGTGGVHRRSGEIFGSSLLQRVCGETSMIWELRQPRANRSNHSARLRVTRTQCEHASSPTWIRKTWWISRRTARRTKLAIHASEMSMFLTMESGPRFAYETRITR